MNLDGMLLDFIKMHVYTLGTELGLSEKSLGALLVFFGAFVVLNFVMLSVLFLIWLERKVAGHIQNRPGPLFVGWHGTLVTLADGIKLIQKEELIPKQADNLLFRSAPYFVFLGMFMAIAVIPFSRYLQVADFSASLLYIFAVGTLVPVGIIIAGWSSNSKYSAFGAMRAAAQSISYEIPLVLSTIGVVMLSGSLSMQGIVQAQHGMWFIVLQPLGFIIYFIAALAEINRPPFDLPEGESELVAGFHSEYSGMRFAMFFLAEFASMFLVCSIATTLFLGGYSGPAFLPGVVWFFAKTYLLILVMMWVRWTVPRYRIDQVMDIGWKTLIPLSLLNILVTGAVMLVM